MKHARMWKWSVGIVVLFLVGLPLVLLTQARIEMTPGGVHTRFLLPAGPSSKIGIHVYSGTGDSPRLPGFLDGPIVKASTQGQWQATWFCEDSVYRQSGTGDVLEIDCAGKQTSYPLGGLAAPAPSKIAAPDRMLVLSDIEGNAVFLDTALRELGVQDAHGRWSYGTGHLVIAGDAVDRGRDVFAVLWRLYSLSLQAARQGGAVHLLLGNHEQYMLRGNMTRAHREHIHATERMGGFDQAFAADTVLGAWLRRQPVIVQAGKVVVTHGGISPQVIASGLSAEQLNDAQRRYWQGPAMQSAGFDAVLGPAGLTQYRGYVDHAEATAPRATPAQVVRALEHFDADTIVVGHTPVEQITPLYQGRVYAIDVNTPTAISEALLFENGVARIVPLRAQRMLASERPPVKTRALNLATAGDWHIIQRWLARSRALSQLPDPY